MKNTLCHIPLSVIGADTFSEGWDEVDNPPHAHVQLRAVTDVNIHHIEELILENRQIVVHDIPFTFAATCFAVLLLRNLKENVRETATEDNHTA
jgi:hypothetical protein